MLSALLVRLTAAPLRGAPRIHGELPKLGHRRLGAHRLAALAEARSSTVTNLAHVPDKSRDVAHGTIVRPREIQEIFRIWQFAGDTILNNRTGDTGLTVRHQRT